jgi:hypothetical protein
MTDHLLAGKHVLVGVTGGIAAYKAVEVCSKLVQAGAEVEVIMTDAATRFVAPLTFSALTGRPVRLDMWTDSAGQPIPHELVICNDSEETQKYVAEYGFDGSPLSNENLTLEAGQQRRIALTQTMPAPGGRLIARLQGKGQTLSSDSLHLFAAKPDRLKMPPLKRTVYVYDELHEQTIDTLRQRGIGFRYRNNRKAPQSKAGFSKRNCVDDCRCHKRRSYRKERICIRKAFQDSKKRKEGNRHTCSERRLFSR